MEKNERKAVRSVLLIVLRLVRRIQKAPLDPAVKPWDDEVRIFSLIKNCGHMSPMESPEDVARVNAGVVNRIFKAE